MKSYSLLIILGLLACCCDYAGGTATQPPFAIPKIWTEEQAVAFALAGNPDSSIARKRIDQARAAATMTKASDYPLFTVSTEYTQTNTPLYSFGNILNQGSFENSIDFNDPGRTDNLELKAQVSYRLYNGGKDQAAQEAADAHINASETDLVAVHQQLGFEVVKTFQAIIQAEEMVTVRQEALASITTALEVGKARFDAGDLLRQDLLNLELQQARASENLIQSEHSLALTKRIFLNLLGLHEGEVHVAAGSGIEQEIPRAINYQNHPRLTKLKAIENEARAELKKSEGEKLPSVDAFASYQYDKGWVLDDNDGDSWMAGVRLNYTIFDGQKSSSQITMAKLRLQEIQSLRKKNELALNLEFQQALLDYEQARKSMTVTEKMVVVAKEAARLSRARFAEGVVLASDLIDFEMRLSDAQAWHLAAQADYRVAIANLRRAAGLDQFSTR